MSTFPTTPTQNGSPVSVINGVPVLQEYNIEAIFTATGQIFLGTGAGQGILLPPGTDGSVLTALFSSEYGVEWAPGGGGVDAAVFSQPGSVDPTVGVSGPFLVDTGFASTMSSVNVAVGTADGGGDDITITYYLNGTSFTTLILSSGSVSTFLLNPGTWPTCGDNTTDYLQAAVTTYTGAGGGSAAVNLVAQIRF